MQAASPAAPKQRLRQRAQLLVQGIDAAPAAEQTETGFDAGRVAPRVQADRQSAVIVDAASPAKANMQWIKPDSLRADTVKKSVGATRFNDLPSAMHCRQSCSERPGVNAIPVRDYERVVDDVKCIRATIERFEGGRWRSTTWQRR